MQFFSIASTPKEVIVPPEIPFQLIFRILNLTILYNAQANVFSIQNVFVLEFTLKMFSSDFSTQIPEFSDA